MQHVATEKEDRSGWPVEERLKSRIIDGDRDGLVADLDDGLAAGWTPLDLVNDVLLDGMRTVGELFGSGQMQLPFVLQSAETMKAAVAHLEPLMEKVEGQTSKGRLVLATVKGDVHDIGKNLVDIILTNNGYEVFNLGIKVPIADMVAKAKEVDADAIGMSGLLVKSTLIMRDNLQELNELGLADVPVLLGGAALTRTYVEKDLREIYEGRLFYGRDAFEGLHTMDRLMTIKRDGPDDPEFGRVPTGRVLPKRASQRAAEVDPATIPDRSPSVATDNPVFVPPFLGSRLVKGLSLDEIAEYVNETALFRNQWQFRPEAGEDDDAFKFRLRPQLRSLLAEAKASGVLVPQVVYGYWPVNSDGQDLVVWTDESRSVEATRFTFPRQRIEPWLCIADFYRSVDERRARLRRLPHRDDGRRRLRGHRRAVRREPVPGVPAAPRPGRRDGRGAGRAVAPPHPRGVGLRRRGRPHHRRPLPPAVPRRPLLLGLPGVPRPRGQRHRRPPPRRRPPRHRGERGDRLAVPARADHLGHHLPPPPGEVLRREVRRTRGAASAQASPRYGARGPRGTRSAPTWTR